MIILMCMISISIWATNPGKVIFNVQEIPEVEGEIFIVLVEGEEEFQAALKGKDFSPRYLVIGKVSSSDTLVLELDNIPYGTYAALLHHDVNGNGKMDTNFFGIPKEGVGFSGNKMGKLGPPKYADAAFEVEGDTALDLTVFTF